MPPNCLWKIVDFSSVLELHDFQQCCDEERIKCCFFPLLPALLLVLIHGIRSRIKPGRKQVCALRFKLIQGLSPLAHISRENRFIPVLAGQHDGIRWSGVQVKANKCSHEGSCSQLQGVGTFTQRKIRLVWLIVASGKTDDHSQRFHL